MTTDGVREFREVYCNILSIAKESARVFGRDRRAAVSVANAQAAVLVRTLCEYTLKSIPKKEHGLYLHWLFAQMVKDLTRGRKMKALVLIKEAK